MELTPEAKDALVGLFAVKLDLCTERSVEKALAKAEPGGLLKELTSMGAVKMSDHPALLEGLDPEVVPGYRIEAEAGRGGMGVVYRARQTSMDRVVALKLLSRRLAGDESYVAKFLDEARSAAKLNHENVVGAINAGEANGLYFFVMEFVDGESVAEHLEQVGPYEVEEAFRIAEGVARGLQHAHEVGIVHRDVKPENVILTSNREVRLCDLGLAKPLAVAGTGEKSDMTEGTPYYCSPEQALGRTDIDARSDVYSLALTLYHMLTGEPAYEGDGAREILVQQVRAPFPDLAQAMPQVPEPLRELLAKMVVKERESRLPSMRDFLRGLDAARNPQPVSKSRAKAGGGPPLAALAGAVLVALLGLGVVGWALFGGTSTPVADDGTDPEGTDPDGETKPDGQDPDGGADPDDGAEPDGGRRRRTGRRRPVDEGDPPSDPPPNPGAASLAEEALERARQYVINHPEDPRGGYERLLGVASAFPDDAAAEEAKHSANALKARVEAEGNRAFEAVSKTTLTLVSEQRYRAALAELEAFREAWREVLPEVPALEILRRTVLESATTRLGELEAAGDVAALKAAADELPVDLADAVAASLARLEAQRALGEAQRAYREAEARFWTALLGRDLGEARRLMQPFEEEAGGAFAEGARARLADAALLEDALAQLARSCASRSGEQTFALDTGGEVHGAVLGYDAAELSFQVEDDDGARAVSLAELSGPELLSLLGEAPGDAARLRACVLLCLSVRAPQGARAALDRAESGGVSLPAAERGAYEAQIRPLEEQVVDARIASFADLEPAEVVRLARSGFSPALRATETYRRGFAQLQAAFLRARGEQLAADPADLLSGKFKPKRTGGMSLEYVFKSQEETADLVAGGFPSSTAEWLEDGQVKLRGRVALRPRFAPGTLKIQAKLRAQDGQRPNVNLLLSPGDWTGCLIGFGYRAGAARDVTIDPAAERKGGFTVSLPCNVLGTLDGRRPPEGLTCMAAEYEPSVLGSTSKVQRIQIDRTKTNDVRVKLGGRSVFRVNDAAGGEPCQLVFAPFNQELILTELEVSGELDPAWLRERGEELAGAEVASLPPPL